MTDEFMIPPTTFPYSEKLKQNAETYMVNCLQDTSCKVEKHDTLIAAAMCIIQGVAWIQPKETQYPILDEMFEEPLAPVIEKKTNNKKTSSSTNTKSKQGVKEKP